MWRYAADCYYSSHIYLGDAHVKYSYIWYLLVFWGMLQIVITHRTYGSYIWNFWGTFLRAMQTNVLTTFLKISKS